MEAPIFIIKVIFYYKINLNFIQQNHITMSKKISIEYVKQPSQDVCKQIHGQQQNLSQAVHSDVQLHPSIYNYHGLFLTHQHKIQATYNFQFLFRKKSHIYNMHKKNRKINAKNLKNDNQNINDTRIGEKNVIKGHWTSDQNKKYHWFLQIYHNHFILKHLRRTDKIFKTMSAFIVTREAEQCRSHHQKMQKKYKNFYEIILKLRMEFYGTSDTEVLKADLLQNGYVKESSSSLIQQNILKSIQKQNEENKSDNYSKNAIQIMSKLEQDLAGMNEQYSQSMEEKDNEQNRKQGNLFFGQHYQKKLNYNLY